MSGFFVLDVPEFAPMIAIAARRENCTVHPLVGGYRFIEFQNEIEITRAETRMVEALWFGCLTAGLIGKIVKFDSISIRLIATNEPVIMARGSNRILSESTNA
jgi:hypothetical protein